ncbi:DNA-binding response regulator [Longimycelium tulufanense]|uniref:DNA-binding response regulator n=1 Tax=Longimycelium tulufanense TaxID=907463 RepID=A0A8J3FX86_9PSEU|nr:response regulator transcription factor [Longimycelium tulufanense]GGM59975.1 DNA-binding response regulator [Longimycelium tulufanense]
MAVTHEYSGATRLQNREQATPRNFGVTVAVVDERPVIRRGIPSMFATTPDVRLVRCFSDVPDLEELTKYDVLVLGIHSRHGVGLLRLTHDLAGHCRLVLLSSSLTLAATLVLLDAGADGYLTTDASEQVFREAILQVARGHLYLHGPVAEVIRRSVRAPAPRLAPREAELLGHLATGLTHAQAARRMGVAVGTVETYVRRIRAKFAISGPVQLARLARQARLQRMLS